jgi:tetratricopeptide (TPR) repeat protein
MAAASFRRRLRGTVVALAILTCLAFGRPMAHQASALDLLDRYAAGQFDAVVAGLQNGTDFAQLLKAMRDQAPAWIDAGGSDDRARRELAAATLALEAARVDEWREWKRIVKPPKVEIQTAAGKDSFQALNTLYWAPAPMLIEWGCALLRQDATPRSIERTWQLAALAVAERSEDPQFLIGDTKLGQGPDSGEILNEQKEIKHLLHVEKRFPTEARFTLAQGIARFRDWPDDAHAAFAALSDQVDVGGEANVRDADLFLREGRVKEALDHLARAEAQTRDPYVLYLAAYFRGVASIREAKPQQAEAAFTRALVEWPRGQSASTALAALLFNDGRRLEAQAVSGAMLAGPPPPDPLREFVHADDRFWPVLIARLRAEIHP